MAKKAPNQLLVLERRLQDDWNTFCPQIHPAHQNFIRATSFLWPSCASSNPWGALP